MELLELIVDLIDMIENWNLGLGFELELKSRLLLSWPKRKE